MEPEAGGEGLDQQGQVAAQVVHEEEEGAEGEGADGGGHQLHQHREQQREPGLRWAHTSAVVTRDT